MPKRYLTNDEWYPVFSLREEFYDWEHSKSDCVEFTDEELADLARVGREFNEWQRRLTERFRVDPLGVDDYGMHMDEPKKKA